MNLVGQYMKEGLLIKGRETDGFDRSNGGLLHLHGYFVFHNSYFDSKLYILPSVICLLLDFPECKAIFGFFYC